jgi:hypothetical protein
MPSERDCHTEPEIIPPGYSNRTSTWGACRFVDTQGTRRIYAIRLGPFGFLLMALAAAIFAAVVLIFLIGAVLLWIPIAILLVAAAITSGVFRR